MKKQSFSNLKDTNNSKYTYEFLCSCLVGQSGKLFIKMIIIPTVPERKIWFLLPLGN